MRGTNTSSYILDRLNFTFKYKLIYKTLIQDFFTSTHTLSSFMITGKDYFSFD